MFSKIDAFIIKYSTIKITLILLALFFGFAFIVFPKFSPSDTNVKPLDIQYFYHSNDVYNTLDQFSASELKLYAISEATNDTIYPIIYTCMLCFALFLLYKNLTLAKAPLIVMLLDYIENTGIIILIKNYPKHLDGFANFIGLISGLKWSAALVVVIIIFVGLLNNLKKLAFK